MENAPEGAQLRSQLPTPTRVPGQGARCLLSCKMTMTTQHRVLGAQGEVTPADTETAHERCRL